MPYVEDENGNHIVDESGNKIEYEISYEDVDFDYIHREPIHVDENRNSYKKNHLNQHML